MALWRRVVEHIKQNVFLTSERVESKIDRDGDATITFVDVKFQDETMQKAFDRCIDVTVDEWDSKALVHSEHRGCSMLSCPYYDDVVDYAHVDSDISAYVNAECMFELPPALVEDGDGNDRHIDVTIDEWDSQALVHSEHRGCSMLSCPYYDDVDSDISAYVNAECMFELPPALVEDGDGDDRRIDVTIDEWDSKALVHGGHPGCSLLSCPYYDDVADYAHVDSDISAYVNAGCMFELPLALPEDGDGNGILVTLTLRRGERECSVFLCFGVDENGTVVHRVQEMEEFSDEDGGDDD